MTITEDDFIDDFYTQNNIRYKIRRCTKRPSVYELDGKYYDDKAVCYKIKDRPDINQIYLYQCQYNSRKEITLPYTPSLEIIVIDKI